MEFTIWGLVKAGLPIFLIVGVLVYSAFKYLK